MSRTPTVLLLSVALAATSCSTLPDAPAYPPTDDAFSRPQEVPRPGLPGDVAPPLTLQPGDVITIELAGEQPRTLSGVVIDGSGQVHVPLAGDVNVAGLTLSEAESRLQAKLREFDRFIQVLVQVSSPAGQRATVLGAVTTQGSVQLVPGARVTDVLLAAGGPLSSGGATAPVPLADLSGAVLTRAGKPLPIDIAKALQGHPLHNVFVRPGDHLFIPPALGANVSVLGQVGGGTVFPHRAGMRLTEALALAGGVTAGADKGDIRVIRGTLKNPRVYVASLSDLVDGDSHDVLLQPGDIIFVTDHRIEDIGEVVGLVSSALSLGLSSVALGLTLSQ